MSAPWWEKEEKQKTAQKTEMMSKEYRENADEKKSSSEGRSVMENGQRCG